MPKTAILHQLAPIQRDKSSTLIVRQLRALIANGRLKPGDRLPPERELAEQFGVSRSQVREALQRLDFFGVLQTFPQSGTRVAPLGQDALQGLISNVLDLDHNDIRALTETRCALEVEAARHAASRAEPEDLKRLEDIHRQFESEVLAGRSGITYDLAFHLGLAEAAKNSVMSSLIAMIAPDIVKSAKDFHTCSPDRSRVALLEHAAILAALRAQDAGLAAACMATHLNMTGLQYGQPVHEPAEQLSKTCNFSV